MLHPVLENAALPATPTSPLTAELVQVTAGPPRMAKRNTGDCAAAGRAVTSSAPNDATTANRAVSRSRVNMVFSSQFGCAQRGIHEGVSGASPAPPTLSSVRSEERRVGKECR